jgi:hypothetical protein
MDRLLRRVAADVGLCLCPGYATAFIARFFADTTRPALRPARENARDPDIADERIARRRAE